MEAEGCSCADIDEDSITTGKQTALFYFYPGSSFFLHMYISVGGKKQVLKINRSKVHCILYCYFAFFVDSAEHFALYLTGFGSIILI